MYFYIFFVCFCLVCVFKLTSKNKSINRNTESGKIILNKPNALQGLITQK